MVRNSTVAPINHQIVSATIKMNKILQIILILASISALALAQYNPEIKWKFTAKEGINSISVGDLDNDGSIEIAVASSIDGMVYVLDSRGEVKWKYSLYCPVSIVYAADLDNDGKSEIMTGSCKYLTVIDSGGNKKWQSLSWSGVRGIYASDIDDDNFKEIIATISTSPYSNGIAVIDETGRKEWFYGMGEIPYSVYASDINNDNKKEIIIGTAEKEGRFFKPGYVYVLNSTGKMLWKFKTGGGINYVSASDIDGDGSEEILVGSYQGFYVLDKNGNEKWNYTTGGYIYDVVVADINKDNSNEIFVGSNDLYVLNKKGNLIWTDKVGTEVYDILIGDIDNDENPEILVGSDRVYIFNQGGALEWKSDAYLSVKGVYAIDLDNDNFKEIIAGALDKSLYVFETANYAKTKLASSYYEKAQNFYTAGDYENASKYAQMAKSLYSGINDNDGISKSGLLISQIEKLSLRIGKDSEDADSFYKKAQDFYFSRQYMNASAYARMARDKYSSVGDSEGISKSNLLIGNVNTGLMADASAYYANATKKSDSGDYDDAISDAKNAREIYAEIRSADDVLKTDMLIAGIYFKVAEERYESKNFIEALKYAQNAKVIYICIESKCDFKNPENISINSIANITYNESPYKEKLMQMDNLIGKITERSTEESNPMDFMKMAVVIVISFILLYLGIKVVGKKNIMKKKNFDAPPETFDHVVSDSGMKIKNFPKKIIKDRSRGAGLPIKTGKISK